MFFSWREESEFIYISALKFGGSFCSDNKLEDFCFEDKIEEER